MPLFRQREQTLRQEMHPRRPDRQLVRACAKQPPFDADPVAEIEQLENLEVERRQRILSDIDLNLRVTVRHGQEVRLAKGSDRQNPSAGNRLGATLLQLVV